MTQPDRNYLATMIDGFDPNEVTKKNPWATYIPNRSPMFKAHARRQDALGALSTNDYGVLYEHRTNAWVEVTRKVRDDKGGQCDNCGISTLNQDALKWGTWHSTGHRSRGLRVGRTNDFDHGAFVLRREKGKVVEPPTYLLVCPDCAPKFRQ